jgi:hypothetical protein
VFDTFMGLPVHALVVHGAVVLLPIMAVLTVLVSIRPSWRQRGAWLVVAGNAVVTGSVFVAKESGEKLEARIGETPALEQHAEFGDVMLYFALGLLVASVAFAALHRRSVAVSRVLGAVAVIAAVAATVWVVQTGHSGAVAVWKDTVDNTKAP